MRRALEIPEDKPPNECLSLLPSPGGNLPVGEEPLEHAEEATNGDLADVAPSTKNRKKKKPRKKGGKSKRER